MANFKQLSATKADHNAFWDEVVRDGTIPTGELTEEDQRAFDAALDRLGEDQTPAFCSFDELKAAKQDDHEA